MALQSIREFGDKVEKNQWSAVIFPEGTRSKDGLPKKFHTKGLMSLFEEIPNATVVALSINNSWKLARYSYFPIPIGTKVNLKVQGIFRLKDQDPMDLFNKIEQLITQGIKQD